MAIGLLENQLRTLRSTLSADIFDRLRNVSIWMSPSYDGFQPTAEYHADVAWLRDNGRRPELVKVVFDHLGLEAKPRVQRHRKSSHCNSTPATDGKRIVAIFGSEGLFCFDMQGRLRWKKDLGPMDAGHYTTPSSPWGFASSPVIHEGKVVVLCDVQEDSFIAVFDLADGKEI